MENKFVIGILDIVEDKLREFGVQIPDEDRDGSADPIVGYQYAELHDRIQEYLEEQGLLKDDDRVVLPGKQVTERDRLITLLDEARDAALDSCESLNNGFGAWYADYLLAHGVRLEAERDRVEESENKEDLRRVCVLTCVHEHRFGDSRYVSVHATEDDAYAHADTVLAECDFEEDREEFFNTDITWTTMDMSKLERVTAAERDLSVLDTQIEDAEEGKKAPECGGKMKNLWER